MTSLIKAAVINSRVNTDSGNSKVKNNNPNCTNESTENSIRATASDGKDVLKYNNNDKEYVKKELFSKQLERNEELELELVNIKKQLDENAKVSQSIGYKEGYKKGLKEGKESLNERLNKLNTVIEGISEGGKTILESKSEDILEIVYAATTKIIRSEMPSVPHIKKVITDTIKDIQNNENITIRLSHEDYNALQDELFTNGEIDLAKNEIIKDSGVSVGGCIVETSNGSIDTRLETQLMHFKELLLNSAELGSSE